MDQIYALLSSLRTQRSWCPAGIGTSPGFTPWWLPGFIGPVPPPLWIRVVDADIWFFVGANIPLLEWSVNLEISRLLADSRRLYPVSLDAGNAQLV